MIYYFVWIFVGFLAVLGTSTKKYRRVCSFIIIGTIVLFAGLRFQRWSDWDMYYDLFNNFGVANKDFEIGFKLFVKIGKYIFGNYNIYLCFLYLVVIILYNNEFKGTTGKYYPFCLLVFLSTTILSSGGQRQFVAGAITFSSIKFVREKKLARFLITVAIASLFHRTALIFIPIFWIDKFTIRFNTFIEISIIGILFGKYGIFKKLVLLSMPLLNRFDSVAYRIRLYANSMDDLNVLSFGFIKRTLVMTIILLVIRHKKNIFKDNNTLRIYINLYAIGFMLSLFIPGTFSRLNNYFYTSEVVIEALTLLNIKRRDYRFFAFGGMLLMNIAIWKNTLMTFYPELLFPYKSCLLWY